MTPGQTITAGALIVNLVSGTSARAQTGAPSPIPNASDLHAATLVGTWQGTLTFGATTFRIGLLVTQPPSGVLGAVLVSIDQDGARIPVQQTTLTGTAVHLDLPGIKASYDGTLDASARDITGTLLQGGMMTPLTFKRVDRLDPSPTFGDKENGDVRALITEYFRAFTARDWDAFRALFQPPYMMWAIGGPSNTFATADDIVARYRTLRESLEGTDYAVSKAARMTVIPLSTTTALVDIHWRRDKKDGSLHSEGGEIIAVLRTPNGWKITGNLARQLSQYGKSF